VTEEDEQEHEQEEDPMTEFFARHQDKLHAALDAIRSRAFWSAYPESAKAYGDLATGEKAFRARLNKPFEFGQDAPAGRQGGEVSPYGFALGITYPRADVPALIGAAQKAAAAWRRTDLEERIGICIEIVDRLNRRSLEMAHAVMHTTGQPLMMAFQAAGPHAQDRALEAIAYAYDAQRMVPRSVRWEKPQGKAEPIRLDKTFRLVPRGIGLVIGCSTFPTWNGYPGMFASLATGNVVIVKPHPTAVLPLALSVAVAREVLAEAGLPEDVVQLAVDSVEAPVAKDLALRPQVGVIDFTGSSTFGTWLEEHARQAQVYTEKAGVNFVVVESPPDFEGMLKNLAFSLSLYSGQMCTTPQDIWVPKDGIDTPEGRKSFNEVAAAIGEAVGKFVADDERAVEILGAIQSEATARRLEDAKGLGEAVLPSRAIKHPKFPEARVRTPLILKVDERDVDTYGRECFGPVTFVIAASSADAALRKATAMAREKGAITAALYSREPAVLDQAEDLCAEAGVALSVNLTGNIYVNQSAAFSDFHATGANPAANATLTDTAFVAGRFRVVQSRVPARA
jgi:phenylacetic acid degradation protein paaN